ncbi:MULTISPECIES: MipA/OmpV family protein [Pseudomonas aeruginosa group]|uniref:MipA/OmpV family protein n=1 Tax=Pseudomonas aeruginosa group TaxID=136841 RepID=UPI0006B2A6FC|nr:MULTISPECIES: MipA/OmpV family protein [Pseudomonas aeruginosa group]KPD31920.1 structural protein MipA [Pseudomonas paraeruginosa]KQB32159.1 structural protein MipA [Pseudomonas paraeruginosa]MDT1027865.1 MipA/OmpV family protein [Pseudomonas paraeruginosa]PHJ34178.1 MipA/OmpV family protein [Pseudomonas paraeruginosa]QQV46253.1 MipA/OmpV family protein [Pseudomonas aeruginosa]
MKTASLCLAGTLAGLCSAATAEEWHYSLGLGASNAPRYSGSDERVSAPLVNLEVEGPYGFFLDLDKGLGWQHDWQDASLALYAGPSERRKDRRSRFHGSDRLNGLGSIDARPRLGLAGTYDIGPVTLGATFEHALRKDSERDTGSAFSSLELSLSGGLYEGRFGRLNGALDSRFGDGDYLRTWYGVSARQAARSRFKAYDAHGGLVSIGASLTWRYPLGQDTSLIGAFDIQRLAGDAGDSPIVERRTQSSLSALVEYRF